MNLSIPVLLPPLPVLFSAGLVLCVLLVNGWTDAPNAIASAVSSGALSFPRAVRLAAVCNLLGASVSAAVHPAVARTVYALSDFGPDPGAASAALCGALASIVLWSVAAWRFGIPTSESHALMAGISGGALSLQGSLSALNLTAWSAVLLGLALSAGLSFLLGRLLGRLSLLLRRPERMEACRRGQVFSAAGMAFLHGAQDGQTFMGVFLLSLSLASGISPQDTFHIPLGLAALCAVTMALGTALGGRRIIQTVAHDMVRLDPPRGLASDLAAAAVLALCTLLGLPASTTHAKTAAILGAGTSASNTANWRVASTILLAWLFTFPACFLAGAFFAKLFSLFL